MNRIQKVILCSLVIAIVLSLTACNNNKIEGRWSVSQLEVDNKKYSIAEYVDLFGEYIDIAFEFGDNKTVTIDREGQKTQGTYKMDGENVVITFNGVTHTLILKDNTLTFDMGEVIVTFER